MLILCSSLGELTSVISKLYTLGFGWSTGYKYAGLDPSDIAADIWTIRSGVPVCVQYNKVGESLGYETASWYRNNYGSLRQIPASEFLSGEFQPVNSKLKREDPAGYIVTIANETEYDIVITALKRRCYHWETEASGPPRNNGDLMLRVTSRCKSINYSTRPDTYTSTAFPQYIRCGVVGLLAVLGCPEYTVGVDQAQPGYEGSGYGYIPLEQIRESMQIMSAGMTAVGPVSLDEMLLIV